MHVTMVLWLGFYTSILCVNTPSWIVVGLGIFALEETLVVWLNTRYISRVSRGTRGRWKKRVRGRFSFSAVLNF